MAIHPDCPGLGVWIHVNDQPLQEHDDRAAVPPKTVERYVEAESGANFEVHYQFAHPFPNDRPVSMIVTIDGRDVDEPLIRPDELYYVKGHVSEGSISNLGKNFYVQKYCFLPLTIEEGDLAPVPEAVKQRVAPIGTISLNFYFIERTRHNKTFELREKDISGLGIISENAVKGEALSHAVSLNNAEPTEDLEYFDGEYADNGEPFATFHFHYRSLKALKDLHIVRRTPEPVDLMDCDEELLVNSSPSEMRRMVAHWKRQEAIRARLKRERSGSVTVVGDNEVLGAGNDIGSDDEQIMELGASNLRRMRLQRRQPRDDEEVIVVD